MSAIEEAFRLSQLYYDRFPIELLENISMATKLGKRYHDKEKQFRIESLNNIVAELRILLLESNSEETGNLIQSTIDMVSSGIQLLDYCTD